MTTEYRYEPSIHEVRPVSQLKVWPHPPMGGKSYADKFAKELASKTLEERRKYLQGDWNNVKAT